MKKSKAIAFILIGIAVIGWTAVVVLPFLDLSLGAKAAWIAVSLGIAETCFAIATILFGKLYVRRLLARLMRRNPLDP